MGEGFVRRGAVGEGQEVVGRGEGGLGRGQVGWGVRWGVLKGQEGFETFKELELLGKWLGKVLKSVGSG